MALNSAQKTKIVYLLGYAAKAIIPESIQYDPILVSRLENLNANIEAIVVDLLSRVDAIGLQLEGAPARNIVKRVGDIELNVGEIVDLRSERKRWLKELGTLLDIPYKGAGGAMISVCN